MKQKLLFALVSIAACASTAAAADGAPRFTTKAVEPFAQCFAAAQDRAARPWSFVPKASGGGTFSDVGARGIARPYFVELANRGTRREIRISAADASVLRAVDQCL
jgi:hypothetical protein